MSTFGGRRGSGSTGLSRSWSICPVTRPDASTPGSSTRSSAGPAPSHKVWLKAQPDEFVDGVETAALDPFRGYANAIRDGLPDAVAVLDAFHVVRLGTQVVDEVRRGVQQDTLGRRGHKHDPLYKIRGLLRHGVEHLTESQQAKLSRCLDAGSQGALTHKMR